MCCTGINQSDPDHGVNAGDGWSSSVYKRNRYEFHKEVDFFWEPGHTRVAAHYYDLLGKESHRMNWVYYGKLYTTKFQAGCFAKRLEQDGWLFGFHDPRLVEIYRSKKGRYGVRFIP